MIPTLGSNIYKVWLTPTRAGQWSSSCAHGPIRWPRGITTPRSLNAGVDVELVFLEGERLLTRAMKNMPTATEERATCVTQSRSLNASAFHQPALRRRNLR